MHKKKKPWAVFIAIALAIVIGSLTSPTYSLLGINFYELYDIIGSLFIKALTLVVVPLVAGSIITGVAKIGADKAFARLGAKTFGFYIGTSLLAILIGLLFVNLYHPGTIDLHSQVETTSEAAQVAKVKEHLESKGGIGFIDVIIQIIPSNIFNAMAQGHMLGIIFFSLLFGFAMSKIESHPSAVLFSFWQGIFQTMIQITHLILKFLPIGVFCLVAKVFATTGLESLGALALFALSVLSGFIVFVFVGLPLLLKFVGGVNPIRHFKAMGPALITAFSTSSSSATLPITIDCVEKRAGVSNRICSLVVPLGTSINMSGSAMYECVAAMFVAQVYGLELTLTTQFLIVILALITSMGVAGIPAASLVAIIVILKTLGLPAEGIGLFIAVDRILDMCRTTVNVFSDSCCAVLVARSEGEERVLSRESMNYED